MSDSVSTSPASLDSKHRAWLRKMGAALGTSPKSGDMEDVPLTGVFPEILWEQKLPAVKEAESMVAELVDAQMPKAELLRKGMGLVRNLERQQKYAEALKAFDALEPKVKEDYERLLRSRLGGVRIDGGAGDSGVQGGYAKGEAGGGGVGKGKGGAAPAEPAPAPIAAAGDCAKYQKEVLKVGSKGPAVECLQKMLGGSVVVDGKFGPGTQKAVQAFQKSKGLGADGIVGPKTWAALGGAPAGAGGPGYSPAKPGKPGYGPSKPGEPGYSKSKPGGSGYSPSTPGEPGYSPPKPGKPGYAPSKPGTPGYSPAKPGKPGYSPSKPGEPGYSKSKPGAPGYSTPSKDPYKTPKVLEETGYGKPPAEDRIIEGPGYTEGGPQDHIPKGPGYTQVETQGSSDEPLAADYFPEGYTGEGPSDGTEYTHTPREDRPKGGPKGGGGASKQPTPDQVRKWVEQRTSDDPQAEDVIPRGRGFTEEEGQAFADGDFSEGTTEGEKRFLAGSFDQTSAGVSGTAVIAEGKKGSIGKVNFKQDDEGTSISGKLAESKDGSVTTTVGGFEIQDGIVRDGDSVTAGQKLGVTGTKKEADFGEMLGLPENFVLKGDKAEGTASGEATISDKGAAVGLQANAGEASLTFGSSGTKGEGSDRDQTFRFGVSEGAGAAARVHWDDADKDGIPEVGIGADFAWASFDIKTEDPIGTSAQMTGGPLGALGPLLNDRNMTSDAIEAMTGMPAKDAHALSRQKAKDWANEAGQGEQDVEQDAAGAFQDLGQQAQEDQARRAQQEADQAQQLIDKVQELGDMLPGGDGDDNPWIQ